MPDLSLETATGGVVAGVDEAGRGPWAGPVVAAAVIIDGARAPRALLDRMDDSKRLKPETRATIAAEMHEAALRDGAIRFGLGAASVAEIDFLNILQATGLAMRRAVSALNGLPGHVLVDGNRLPALPCPATAVVKGDGKCLSIAAASILAKTTRDRAMARLAARYPAFGWDHNAGYGTRHHQEALRVHGPTPHHRRSFRPIAQLLLDTAY